MPGEAPDDRPFLLVNMIATADGRATIAGRTGPIANRADYELFHALRTRVDAVMVGAETVRVESYGPMEPAAVLVTRSVQVPPTVGLLRAPDNRVVVLTPSPDRALAPCAAAVEYLRDDARRRRPAPAQRARHALGPVRGRAAPARRSAARTARRRAAPRDRAEARRRGGPDDDRRPAAALDPPAGLRLLSLHECGDYLFLRYGA